MLRLRRAFVIAIFLCAGMIHTVYAGTSFNDILHIYIYNNQQAPGAKVFFSSRSFDEEVLAFFHHDLYLRYLRSNEFDRKRIVAGISDTKTRLLKQKPGSYTISLPSSVRLGEYDFNKKSFPIHIGSPVSRNYPENTGFTYVSAAKSSGFKPKGLGTSFLPSRVNIKFMQNAYTPMPVPPNEAEDLIKSIKNRTLYTTMTFSLEKTPSVEKWKKWNDFSGVIKGRLTRVDFFLDKERTYKVMTSNN